jgi:hypothetical protein
MNKKKEETPEEKIEREAREKISEYEASFLGGLLSFGMGELPKFTVQPFCFSSKCNGLIFQTYLKQLENGTDPNIQTVSYDPDIRAKDIPISYISSLTNKIPSAANIQFYETEIIKAWQARTAMANAERFMAGVKRTVLTGDIESVIREQIRILSGALFDKQERPHFERIGNAAISPIKWIVKGILESGALCMIFGGSGTCKSFFAIALSACIATGKDFFGHKVKKGAVYYIAAEGSAGITRRFRAWAQENKTNITNAPVYRYTGAVNLLCATDTLIKALENAIENENEPPTLAVIDTWSRSLAGDDSDTGVAADGLAKLDVIRAKFPGLAIVIIHHTGHHDKNRARGAYLIHAAVDSEFKIEKNASGNIILTNTKSKESELLPLMSFKAKGVKLLANDGRYLLDADGEIETSIILEKADNTLEHPPSQEAPNKPNNESSQSNEQQPRKVWKTGAKA